MARKGHKINGLAIAKWRTEQTPRVTQAQLADRVGVHWVTQSRIETNKAVVSLDLAEKFAEVTGIPRDELLRDDEAEAASMAAGGPLTPAEIEVLGDLMARLIRPKVAA